MVKRTFLVGVLMSLAILVGCERQVSEFTSEKNSPLSNTYGLEDCRYIKLNTGDTTLRVIRCPLSDTTTEYTHSCGKGCTKRDVVTVNDMGQ